MPRAKPRLTRKKKSKARQAAPVDPELAALPTDAEWESLTKKKYFDVGSPPFRLRVGTDVLILGQGMSPTSSHFTHELWVGRILELARRRPLTRPVNDPGVWAKVQWYYSGADVANDTDTDPANILASCGRYERLRADESDYDYVAHTSFNGPAKVVEYREADIEQPPIANGEFYVRRAYSRFSKRATPKLKDLVACTPACNTVYNPDDARPMHFCPKPACRRWFHRDCLEHTASHSVHVSVESHAFNLLRSDPDSDAPFPLPPPPPPPHASSPPRGRESGKRAHTPPPPPWTLPALPAKLREAAAQQMLKGVPPYGLVGNAQPIAAARRLVYACLRARAPAELRAARAALDEWMERMDCTDVEGLLADADGGGPALYFAALFCPLCGGAI